MSHARPRWKIANGFGFALVFVLVAAGCAEDQVGDVEGYVLLDREARAAGAQLVVDGVAVADLLPERIEPGMSAVVETSLGALPVEVGSGELVVLRGSDAHAEPYILGSEASPDRLVVDAPESAITVLADRLGAEVIDRADGRYELFSPGLLGDAGRADANLRLYDVAPVLMNEALADAVGLPAATLRADDVATLDTGDASRDAMRLAIAFLNGAGLTGAREETSASARAVDRAAPVAERLASPTLPLLVGVYRLGERTLLIDAAGGFEMHPSPSLAGPAHDDPWDVTVAPLPSPTVSGRVVFVPETGTVVLSPSAGPPMEVDAYSDGSVRVAGEAFPRHVGGES